MIESQDNEHELSDELRQLAGGIGQTIMDTKHKSIYVHTAGFDIQEVSELEKAMQSREIQGR